MAFIGEVKPVYGRWHWPFRSMEPGDWFVVDHALKLPSDVGHYVNVRSTQLGIPLRFMQDDPDRPGYCRVTRPDTQAQPEAKVIEASWELAKNKLREWYGVHIDELPYGMAYLHETSRVDRPQVVKPSVEAMIFDAREYEWIIGITFDAEGFTLHRLPRGTGASGWKPGELKLDEVMQ